MRDEYDVDDVVDEIVVDDDDDDNDDDDDDHDHDG